MVGTAGSTQLWHQLASSKPLQSLDNVVSHMQASACISVNTVRPDRTLQLCSSQYTKQTHSLLCACMVIQLDWQTELYLVQLDDLIDLLPSISQDLVALLSQISLYHIIQLRVADTRTVHACNGMWINSVLFFVVQRAAWSCRNRCSLLIPQHLPTLAAA